MAVDDGQAIEELRRDLRAAAAERRGAERRLSEELTIARARAAVQRDLEGRSSPELRSTQARLDGLRGRLLHARESVDHIELLMQEFVDAVEAMDDVEKQATLRGFLDMGSLRSFHEALGASRAQRARTDEIGSTS